MKFNNPVLKVIIIVCYAVLFGIATYFGKSTSYFDALFFVLGLVLGFILLQVDELYAYSYYNDDSHEKQNAVPQNERQLVTRSLLFIIILFPLGLYLMTSTGSAIGVGLFIGIISGIAIEMASLRNNSELFHQRFLYQLKRKLSAQEEKIFRAVFIGASFFYGLIVIFMGR